ncbi:MAG: hypothetical protein V4673_09115 [Pseudomonadota bacterium]
MTDHVVAQLTSLIERIRAHRVSVDAEARRLRPSELAAAFDNQSAHLWCLSVVGDSLVRIRLLIEQNFNFVETLGVVAVSRYLFELSVWLKLFEIDERYGFVYYDQLIETQKNYYHSTLRQFHREVALLREFDRRENERQDALLATEQSPEDRARIIHSVADSIDAEAARKFSIYSEHAKHNGYDFQAYLVESNAIPSAELALIEIENERSNFDANILPKVSDLMLDNNGRKKRWKWNEMAKKVELQDEYDYIYAFSSKLLHATPASITTNQKNLEPEEIKIFLKYIEVKVADVLDASRKYCLSAT